MWCNLKKVDYFRKYTSSDKIQTLGGACVSLLALLLIGLFSWYEVQTYFQPRLNREVTIMANEKNVSTDMFSNNALPFNIDLTLLHTPCESKSRSILPIGIYVKQHEIFGLRSIDPKFLDNFYLIRLDAADQHAIAEDYVSPEILKEHPKVGAHIQRLLTQVADKEGCHVFGWLGTNKVPSVSEHSSLQECCSCW
eukprot:TRINITY_DN112379_c0_g1_i1.p2 TRINITY_DN112379_c0_g1~~TRINITY_DN112379_c0_g1_i1.p2  ORF type:complete len:211 (-),score=36.72 TRINITY_DN112379_c0_g1_i1:359-943(-)